MTLSSRARHPGSGFSDQLPAQKSPLQAPLRLGALFLLLATVGCEASPAEPGPRPEQPAPSPSAEKAQAQTATEGDPSGGQFTLEQATKGLPEKGTLTATLETSLGSLECELFEDKAPLTVANFVGLARGLRPFKDRGRWQTRPAYDGTTFHRVIQGFMIQGGDPSGNGSGEPGYVIPDEIWPGATHDQRGLLCMANRGPNTNGMQFFITDAAAPHLDRSYTIFGKCGPDAVIEKLASVETYGRKAPPGQRPDRPLDPPKIKRVVIERAP